MPSLIKLRGEIYSYSLKNIRTLKVQMSLVKKKLNLRIRINYFISTTKVRIVKIWPSFTIAGGFSCLIHMRVNDICEGIVTCDHSLVFVKADNCTTNAICSVLCHCGEMSYFGFTEKRKNDSKFFKNLRFFENLRS